jgi:O-antigen ligase
MELTLSRKLFYFFPVLFCFCLPFGSLLLSGIIVLWVFTSFFVIDKQQLAAGFRNRNLWLFYFFFFLTFISALLSEDRTEAVFSVEVKLSFILFPYLLFCFTWPSAILKRCIVSFVSGCFFACLYLLGRAFLYSFQGHPEYFFYSLFSDFIHTSYFAMYLMMAIIFVVVLYPKWFSMQKSVIYSSYFFVVIFAASIFFCSSKLGIISFFVCGSLLALYKWKFRFSFIRLALAAIVMTFVLLLSFRFFPSSLGRLESLSVISARDVDKTSAESTAVRLLIWEQAIQIIRQNFFTGTGVGDANAALYKAYE